MTSSVTPSNQKPFNNTFPDSQSELFEAVGGIRKEHVTDFDLKRVASVLNAYEFSEKILTTALSTACQHPYAKTVNVISVVQLLLEKGANPNGNPGEDIPLVLVCDRLTAAHGSVVAFGVLEVLLKHPMIDVNLHRDPFSSALRCIFLGDPISDEAASLLLEKGAKFHGDELEIAEKAGRKDLVDLLKKNDFQESFKIDSKTTLPLLAVKEGFVPVVKLFEDRQITSSVQTGLPSTSVLLNSEQIEELHAACAETANFKKMSEILVELDPTFPQHLEVLSEVLVHAAGAVNSYEHVEIIQALVNKGANVNHVDACGMTALNALCGRAIPTMLYYQSPLLLEVLKFLLQKGANPNLKAGFLKTTPLNHIKNFEMMQELFNHGADLNHCSTKLVSPLKVIQDALIGAQKDVKNNPEDGANLDIVKNYENMIALLKEKIETGSVGKKPISLSSVTSRNQKFDMRLSTKKDLINVIKAGKDKEIIAMLQIASFDSKDLTEALSETCRFLGSNHATVRIVELLLEKGANPNGNPEANPLLEQNPLLLVCEELDNKKDENSVEIQVLKILLKAPGIKIDQKNDSDFSALELVLSKGEATNAWAEKLLIEKGAQVGNNEGSSATDSKTTPPLPIVKAGFVPVVNSTPVLMSAEQIEAVTPVANLPIQSVKKEWVFQCQLPPGDTLYARGNSNGLNWEGIALTQIGSDKWKLTIAFSGPCSFKLLHNDTVWQAGNDMQMTADFKPAAFTFEKIPVLGGGKSADHTRLTIKATIDPEYKLNIRGNGPDMGEWSKVISLARLDSGTWIFDVKKPFKNSFEYKFFITGPGLDEGEWELGDNNRVHCGAKQEVIPRFS